MTTAADIKQHLGAVPEMAAVGEPSSVPRRRLPWRRPGETVQVEFEGHAFTITVGSWPENVRPGEVFIAGAKPGSALDRLLGDAAVLVSLLLQAGANPRELAARLGRLEDGRPASVVGAAVELLAARDAFGR